MKTYKEKRQSCLLHEGTLKDLKDALFGNGKIGIKDRVIKMEVLIWIVIVLLVGNGSLLGWTIKTVNRLSEMTAKIETQNKIKEIRNEERSSRFISKR